METFNFSLNESQKTLIVSKNNLLEFCNWNHSIVMQIPIMRNCFKFHIIPYNSIPDTLGIDNGYYYNN